MKKILIMFILTLSFFAIGCDKAKKPDYSVEYKAMENKLIEFGKQIFETEEYLNDETEADEIFINLLSLDTNERNDTSIFRNPKTGEKCDFEKSGITFIFNGKDETTGEYNYEIKPILICGNDTSDAL